MIMTKKRHEQEMKDLEEGLVKKHRAARTLLKADHAKKEKEFREFMERTKAYTIRHGRPTLADGTSHTYTMATEISMELMHNALRGSHHMAHMVANEIRESAYLALVALCHLDQPPRIFKDQP